MARLVNVEFSKDRGQYQKGDVVEMSDYHASMLLRGDGVSKTDKKANCNASKLSKRQEEAAKSKAQELKKKAKDLEA